MKMQRSGCGFLTGVKALLHELYLMNNSEITLLHNIEFRAGGPRTSSGGSGGNRKNFPRRQTGVFLATAVLFALSIQAVGGENPYVVRKFIKNDKEIAEIIVPGKPPAIKMAVAAEPVPKQAAGLNVLANMPAFTWCYGCSATSAAMIMGYYDNSGYANMYTGPANGGVCPMNNETYWGSTTYPNVICGECPLSATRLNLDGRVTRGHVDEYWIDYGNVGPDPYIVNGWTEHSPLGGTADYMGTNQSKYSSSDGSTTFYSYTDGSPLYNYTGCEPGQVDGCHGLKDFVESRGYTVTANFSQYIYPNSLHPSNTQGFTFTDFKAEIDAGRPVLIQVEGHTMVGYGYDDTGSTVYIRDTWDHASHTMTWGGSYSGMTHYGVAVLRLAAAVTPGFTVSAISGNTTEAGGTATFTVRLTSQPTADVTIGLSSSDTTEGTVSPASLTFTSANWNTNQTVTVTGVDDSVVDGTVAYSIVTAAATSADPNYNGLNPADVSVTNIDNDVAGFTIGAISGNTTEAGGTATFTVRLTSQPTANVSIALTSSDTTEGTVGPTSLTFTSGNWNSNQIVTVTGVDDLLLDGNVAYSIVTASATSVDTNYNGLNATDVSVTNIDNEVAAPGVVLGAISGNTTEAGGAAMFTVRLTSQPTANVSIALTSSDTTEGTVSPASLTFTSVNWAMNQVVTITGVDDAFIDGNVAYSIVTAPATSADPNYNGINPADVAVMNIDNDVAGFLMGSISGNTTEAGGAAMFTVRLTSQPTANVSIALTSSDTTEGTVGPASLTFTSGNWNSNQIVTVTGVDDSVVDGNIVYSIVTAAAVSSDSNYSSMNPPDIAVTNNDNDIAGFTLSKSTSTVPENGGTDTFTVVLTAQPASNVVLNVTSSATGEATVSPATLTFTPANWNSAQTLTITGVNDNNLANNASTLTVSVIDASSDNNWDPLADKTVAVTCIDDETTLTVTNDGYGTTTPSGPTVVTKSAATSISASSNNGYHFLNWTVTSGAASLGNANFASTTATITGPATIRANFGINTYLVTFNLAGKGIRTAGGELVQTVNHGSAAIAPTVTANAGWIFNGWDKSFDNIISELTLTAQYAPIQYTVTYDAKGGAVSPTSKTVTFDSAYGTLAVPTRTGYTFAGWWTGVNGTGTQVTAATVVSIASDHTICANWTANNYTLTYDAKGGAVSPTSKTVTFDSAYGTLAVPTRTGYAFAGWWTGVNGTGTQVTAATIVSIASDHTICANWTANNYKLTYDAKGGSVSPTSKTVTFDSAYGTLAVPTRTGYTFAGWWTGVNGTGTKITAVTIVSNAANHTLYAKWIPPIVGVALETPLPPGFEGLNITVTGLPAGLKYATVTRMITGVPTKSGTFTVVITAPGVPSKTITIVVEALPLWAQGTFNGVAYLDLTTFPGAETWKNFPGTASMTVASLGKITGKITCGGKKYILSAKSYSPMDASGTFRIQAEAKAGTISLPLIFTVNMPAANQEVTTALLGAKADCTHEGANAKCEIHMYRNICKDPDMAVYVANYGGYYTAVLPGGADYGSGYLAIIVDKTGGVKITGKLADGTVLLLSGPLILDETGRIFTVIYTSPTAYNGGCLFGLAEFVKPEGGGHVFLRLLDGVPFLWQSLNTHATSVNGEGFYRELGLAGGWYDKIGNLYDYYSTKVLTAGTDAGAAVPELTVGGNTYESICWDPSDIGLTPVRNTLGMMTGLSAPKANLPVKVNGVWNYNAANSMALNIGLTRATGIFKGSFKVWFDYNTTHTSKSVSYEGVLIPEREFKDDGIEGRGFFLWPDKGQYINPLGRTVTYPFNWSYDFLINE